MSGTKPITETELAQFEKLLGGLLVNATPREEDLILHIHQRIHAMYAEQAKSQDTINWLKQLANTWQG